MWSLQSDLRAETGNLNASPSSNQTRSPEKFEKPEKEIEAQLINEPPGNGSSNSK